MIGNVESAVRDGVPDTPGYRCGTCSKWYAIPACESVGLCERQLIGLSMRMRSGLGAESGKVAQAIAESAACADGWACAFYSEYTGWEQ